MARDSANTPQDEHQPIRFIPKSLREKLTSDEQQELIRAQIEIEGKRRAAREEASAAQAAADASSSLTGRTMGHGPQPSRNRSDDLPQPLGTAMEGILARVAQRREEALRQRQAEEADFYAAGGTCFDCRDTGPCGRCARGRPLLEKRIADEHRMRRLKLLQDLPPRLLPFTFDTFPVPDHPAVAACHTFLTGWHEQRGVVLQGPVGTGKTGLLAAMLQVVAEAWAQDGANTHRLRFTTGPELMRELRAGYDDDSYNDKLYKIMVVRLLAIDDLGAERPTEWVQEQLFTIVNYRYEHQLPTWITTNYGLDELSERIGPRVMDRLMESAYVIAVDGRSLRQLQRGQKGGR